MAFLSYENLRGTRICATPSLPLSPRPPDYVVGPLQMFVLWANFISMCSTRVPFQANTTWLGGQSPCPFPFLFPWLPYISLFILYALSLDWFPQLCSWCQHLFWLGCYLWAASSTSTLPMRCDAMRITWIFVRQELWLKIIKWMGNKLFLHQSRADHKSAEVHAREGERERGREVEGGQEVFEARNEYIAYCFMGNT